ncbi:MAG: M3 family oligoendopeptidase [Rickettsiales bacterium]|nr:M3 family oligoendopeptidase [Pseudomonadota bacterium]MDA0966802.1 M3 family oligoendopeptidase [Pseudomonadota bacterium]MDG4543474.1 M3 family oligoendopeptidase [Rickettsiales bacterium]MDG4546132.1 M3 family oligoendopeptidase [Rickettsiales bacterium]MDG4547605.1 M3 family oligoendopeptidase [Rickettsiales bacterium]
MKAQKVEQTLPTWDLSALYPSKESGELKSDIKNVEDRAKRFQKIFEGKIKGLDGKMLASTIREYEEIEETLGRLHSFAYLLYAENISSQENSAFYQNISEKITEISSLILFFELEINKISDKEMDKKHSSSSELKKYQPWIRDVRVMKPYQLSDEVEKILHEKSITSRQSWHRLFEETMADLRFPFDDKKLTAAEVMNFMSSKNEDERKKAAKSVGKTLGENIKKFALITNVLAKDKEINDRWRKFSKPISSRNLANLIEDEVAEALINSVKKNYEKLGHRYYKIKAGMFGKKQLDYWDRNAPLPDDKSEKISWNDAVETVIEAYSDFSPEMAKIGKRFFDENWIDAPAREGKDSGAFSHPTVPSAHPYILMNFQGKIRDVMTLAHELGHGVHQYLAAGQGALMASTPLTLAETASVFGEQLTFRKLLERQTSEQQKKIMIANKVEDMLNTVVRQIAFCEFERQVHDERKNGEIPAERLCEIWLGVQKESLGPAIKYDDEYKYFWSYIPHFVHTPFYVYAYAFGDCLVNSLYKVYQDKPDGFVDKYIEMLKAGGTLRHKELLEPFGLDASNPKFWQGGLDIISGFIDEIE